MKKLLLLLFISSSLGMKAQTYVHIPDPSFSLFLQQTVPTAMLGDSLNINDSIVQSCTGLIMSNKGIIDLTGIQYFTSLGFLNCQNNQISNLTMLPNSLKTLWCDGNPIDTIVLPPGLRIFHCISCSMTSLPPLPNTIQDLRCYYNAITSLPAVLPDSITYLDFSSNQISCVPILPSTIINLYSHPNNFTCFSNYIPAMRGDTLIFPRCGIGNPGNCIIQPICTSTVSFSLLPDTSAHVWNIFPNYPPQTVSASWSWGDSTVTDSLYPSHTYTSSGIKNICVTVIDSNHCATTYCQNDSVYRNSNSNSIIQAHVINSSTGMDRSTISPNTLLNVFPNPANHRFTIKPNSPGQQTINLFNINGSLVLTQIINGTSEIDVSHLNDGVYTLNVISSNAVVTKKLVVVK